MAEPNEPYKVYFHWSNDNPKGELKAVSCDQENVAGEKGFWANFSHFFESFKGGLPAACLTVKEANTLQLKKGGFLYMDVGCWLNGKQTFGLICGEDAAVCRFETGKKEAAASGSGKSLFDQFIQLPGVSVVSQDKIQSPHSDPKRLYLILPDMHVPDAPPLNGWGNDLRAFVELSKRDLFNSRASITAMLLFQLLVVEFGHASEITLVQLGDMYELWAGREREFEFTPPKQPKIIMKPGGDQEVGEWIGRTHHRWPALFQGFDQCAASGIKMLFLHGNHDDYLSRPEVVAAANAHIQKQPIDFSNTADADQDSLSAKFFSSSTVYPRQPEINEDHIFIEHGQRCDPYNRDGAMDGFNNCNSAVAHPILQGLGAVERAMFVVGAAAKWCVQERNFCVYVMGHTHTPNLKRVEVYHQREGTDYVFSPDGVAVEVKTETPLEGTE